LIAAMKCLNRLSKLASLLRTVIADFFRCWFRFRLIHVLSFVALLASAILLGRQHQLVSRQSDLLDQLRYETYDLRCQLVRLSINDVLRSNLSDREKLDRLAPFVETGDLLDTAAHRLGPVKSVRRSTPLEECTFSDCDLVLGVDSDRTVRAIGYYESSGDRSRRPNWRILAIDWVRAAE
jgi:hypothetical protein